MKPSLVIPRGDALPTVTRILKDTTGALVSLNFGTDTVKFRMVDVRTNQVHLDWADATISDPTASEVSFSWDATTPETDVTPGFMSCQFRVTFGATNKEWTHREPFYLEITNRDQTALAAEQYFFANLYWVKRRLDIGNSESDDILRDIIETATQHMEIVLGRYLIKRTFTHDDVTLPKLSGNGTPYLYLPQAPILSLTSVEIEDETPIDTTDRYEFRINKERGLLTLLGRNWTEGDQNIAATFEAGWTTHPDPSAAGAVVTIPPLIVQVGMETCGRLWKEKDQGGPQAQVTTIGDKQVTFRDPIMTKEQVGKLLQFSRHSYA